MYALFMLCAVVGGFLMLLLTPQALAVPTLWIGGLLFFGLGALIDRVGAAINTLGASK
jgi:lipoprotein signal peptidase